MRPPPWCCPGRERKVWPYSPPPQCPLIRSLNLVGVRVRVKVRVRGRVRGRGRDRVRVWWGP